MVWEESAMYDSYAGNEKPVSGLNSNFSFQKQYTFAAH